MIKSKELNEQCAKCIECYSLDYIDETTNEIIILGYECSRAAFDKVKESNKECFWFVEIPPHINMI